MSESERFEESLSKIEAETERLKEFNNVIGSVRLLIEQLEAQKTSIVDAEQLLKGAITSVDETLESLSGGKESLLSAGEEIRTKFEGFLTEMNTSVTKSNTEHQEAIGQVVSEKLELHKKEITESHRSEVAHVADKLTVALEKVSLSLSAEINNKFSAVKFTSRILMIIQILTAALVGIGFFYMLQKLND